MAPSLLVLVLLLSLCSASASACENNSISNLFCFYNYNRSIRCEWTTDRTDMCSLQAHNLKRDSKQKFFQAFDLACALELTERPRLRRCSLQLNKTILMVHHVLSLKLSCVHMAQSLVTQYRPLCHVKLDAMDAPTVNGSSLSWTKPRVLKQGILQYEIQWTPQHRPWADGWSKKRQEWNAELQTDSLVLGQKYSARVRVRAQLSSPSWWSEWSEWSPTLSWTSAVGKSQETATPHASGGVGADGAGVWTAVTVVVFTLGLVVVLFGTSRVHRVYMMKLVKGVPLPSPTPSVLKLGWQPPLFSNDSYLAFFKPEDIITSVELLPLEPRSTPDCLLPPEDNPSSPSEPLRFSQSNFSNPMYSEVCPNPDPDPSPEPADPLGDLDLLLLLSTARQSPGVDVVCEYERVEGPGGDRVRLTSVDSGVGSGEEVSQDSLHVEEHSAVTASSVEDQTVSTHTAGLLPPTVQS